MPAQTHSRRRMTAESRHVQILDIAHAIVDTEGFHAATLNRIASEARVTRTVIYQQFGDLAGVFIALIEREGARARSQFAEAIAASEPNDEDGAFGRTFASVLRAADANPATWRLFLFPPEGAPPELHERLAVAEANVRRYLATVLVDINPDIPDPEYTAHVLHAAGRELIRLRLTNPEAATHERILAHVRRLTPELLRHTR
jgi:AcrR family transcriptional regulator